MKLLTSAICLSSLSLSAAPTLSTNHRISPESEIRIVFDNPMVDKDQIGIKVDSSWLRITPQWNGSILWKTANTALFIPSEAATLNTSYKFATPRGLKDLEGNKIKPTQLGSRSSFPFQIIRSKPLDQVQNTPRPRMFLCFTDDVKPADLAPYFFYQTQHGKQQAAATLRQATFADINSTYFCPQSWTQRHKNALKKANAINQGKVVFKPETILPNCIVVSPQEILPTGHLWSLQVLPGMPNTAKNAALKAKNHYSVGSKSHFKATHASAITPVDKPPYIRIKLSSPIADNLKEEDLKKHIQLSPAPENMSLKVNSQTIDIFGDFAASNYTIDVTSGLKAAHGLTMHSSYTQKLRFSHVSPSLAIPSFAKAQHSKGQRSYPVQTVNMSQVRIRVKALSIEQAVRTQIGHMAFLKGQQKDSDKKNNKRTPLPFTLVEGTLIHDKKYLVENPLNTSHDLILDWDEILPEKKENMVFFLDVEGTPKSQVGTKSEDTHHVQSFLQLTNIGLAWKMFDNKQLIYCYSCETGKPMANVTLRTYDKEAKEIDSWVSDEKGIVYIPSNPKASHLSAQSGSDVYILPVKSDMSTVDLWRFPVEYEWYQFPGWKREVLMFTDRGLYKPGERVNIKGVVRERKGNKHRVAEQKEATLLIYNNQNRVILEEEITLSNTGSFDHSLKLNNTNVGRHRIKLQFEIPQDKKMTGDSHEAWNHNWQLERNAQFTKLFNVQEFRKNAFKVSSKLTQDLDQPLNFNAKINAAYYMGTAVSKAKAHWYLTTTDKGFYPKNHRDYYFGNHLKYDPHYWAYYYGYNNGRYHEGKDQQRQNGTSTLDEEGFLSLDLNIKSASYPSARQVSLLTEVIDGRNQTISSRSNLTIHPSSHYLGIKRIDGLLRVGDSHDMQFIAVDPAGMPNKADIKASVTIQRISNEAVKVKAPNGKVTVNNQKIEHLFLQRDITIQPGQPVTIPFKPKQSGTYKIIVQGKDAKGNLMKSAVKQRVYGSNAYPWAVNSGIKIELTPEQKHYKPGDTARILVMTPIEGTALVTTEREGITRHFHKELKSSNPVIEIPIGHDDAPNVYVSVLLIRGSKDSTHTHPEPALKLGYCNLNVENIQTKLNVVIDTPSESYLPGSSVTLTGSVTNYLNKPVSDGEITFYAQDNGVLDVIGYQMPKPHKFFNSKLPLYVSSGTSLHTFLQEAAAKDMDMINRSVMYKGYTIGGGDGFAMQQQDQPIRKNFDPCAVWQPSLKTDANGRFSATFTVPESLTSYRVMAVASAGNQLFGSSKSEIVINKPLMLEPMTPRFANEGDVKRTKVYVANNSAFEATWEVSLKTGSLSRTLNSSDPQLSKQSVTLKPGNSAYLSFDTRFVNTGKAQWTWSAEPTQVVGNALNHELKRHLSDSMQSSFNVIYPRPIIRSERFHKLGNNRKNLLQNIDPNLMAGRGEIELGISNNLLFKVRGAADHLLRYPYG